jgi:diguanylate cyclase
MSAPASLFGLLPLATDPNVIGAALTHDRALLALSLAIALAASFSFLELAGASKKRSGAAAAGWRAGAGFVLGIGVWATHFTGLLALDSPLLQGVPLQSGFVACAAMVACAVMGMVVAAPDGGLARFALAGFLIGAGAQTMHYLDLMALPIEARLSFQPVWIALAAAAALATSVAAPPLAYALDTVRQRALIALPMAAVMAGLHHVGIAAVIATPTAGFIAPEAAISNTGLAFGITATVLVAMGLGILAARLAPSHSPTQEADAASAANPEPIEVTGDPIVILPRKRAKAPGDGAG